MTDRIPTLVANYAARMGVVLPELVVMIEQDDDSDLPAERHYRCGDLPVTLIDSRELQDEMEGGMSRLAYYHVPVDLPALAGGEWASDSGCWSSDDLDAAVLYFVTLSNAARLWLSR